LSYSEKDDIIIKIKLEYILLSKPTVFMIMPFQDEFLEVYEMLKIEFNSEFDFSNAGEVYQN